MALPVVTARAAILEFPYPNLTWIPEHERISLFPKAVGGPSDDAITRAASEHTVWGHDRPTGWGMFRRSSAGVYVTPIRGRVRSECILRSTYQLERKTMGSKVGGWYKLVKIRGNPG